MPRRSTIEVNHLVSRLEEQYLEKKRDLHTVFEKHTTKSLEEFYGDVWRLKEYMKPTLGRLRTSGHV